MDFAITLQTDPPARRVVELAARAEELELESLGVTQFDVYLMHDDMEATLEAYGREVIPALRPLAAS
jgi:hypothetical protein